MNFFVCTDGFVFASASPGAGLYAEGSLSDFLDCDLKYESRFVFVDLEIPLKYFAYGFGAVEPMKFTTQFNFLKKISKWGFSINPLSEIVRGVNENARVY